MIIEREVDGPIVITISEAAEAIAIRKALRECLYERKKTGNWKGGLYPPTSEDSIISETERNLTMVLRVMTDWTEEG